MAIAEHPLMFCLVVHLHAMSRILFMGHEGYCSDSASFPYAVVMCILSSLHGSGIDFCFHAFFLLVAFLVAYPMLTGFLIHALLCLALPFVCPVPCYCSRGDWLLTLCLGD